MILEYRWLQAIFSAYAHSARSTLSCKHSHHQLRIIVTIHYFPSKLRRDVAAFGLIIAVRCGLASSALLLSKREQRYTHAHTRTHRDTRCVCVWRLRIRHVCTASALSKQIVAAQGNAKQIETDMDTCAVAAHACTYIDMCACVCVRVRVRVYTIYMHIKSMCVQTNYIAIERKLRERREEAAKQTTNLQAETSCTVLFESTFEELI